MPGRHKPNFTTMDTVPKHDERSNCSPPPEDDLATELHSSIDEIRGVIRELRDEVRTYRKDVQKHRSDENKSLLTRQEAADRLRISTRTLDDREAAGEVQAIRIGGRVLYHRDALDAYIRRCGREGRK